MKERTSKSFVARPSSIASTGFARDVEMFLRRTKKAPATFGREAVSDPSFVAKLRSGRYAPTLRTVDKVRAHIKNNSGETR